MLPPEILDLILSWHMPVCAQAFAGNPRYILYWCYDKGALREVLGMTRDQYRVVQSSLGKFMRRVPKTNQWLSKLSGQARTANRTRGARSAQGDEGWALKGSLSGGLPIERVAPDPLCGDGGLQTHEPRIPTQASGRRSGLAAARKNLGRKSYVGLPAPGINQFT